MRVDRFYFRPAEVQSLLGDPRKAREKLGWTPRTSFEALVAEMAEADLTLARRERRGGVTAKVVRPEAADGSRRDG